MLSLRVRISSLERSDTGETDGTTDLTTHAVHDDLPPVPGPPSGLPKRLGEDRWESFLGVKETLPKHLSEIFFGLQ